MIYTMFGSEILSVRYATLEDVRVFEGREPDVQACQAIADQSWVVATRTDQTDLLTHIAKLRADGGLAEILRCIREREEVAR